MVIQGASPVNRYSKSFYFNEYVVIKNDYVPHNNRILITLNAYFMILDI